MGRIVLIGILVILFASCTEHSNNPGITYPQVQYPNENAFSLQKAELGRKLFYETGLSLDSSVSCASCHIQDFAFADTARVSRGFARDTGFRNSSSLTNVAFQSTFFRDGGVHSLERAVHPPVLTEFEMNILPDTMIVRLKSNSVYLDLFKEAFDGEPDYKSVVYALATFQRTIISFQAPYDAYMAGDSTALSQQQIAGLKLFRSEKLQCAKCHIEPLFIDNEMHNIGLYEVYQDYGRGRVTLDSADYGKFRTPTLRNIAVTWPYMHDGSLGSLQDVLMVYSSGGKNHPNKSALIKPFSITEEEQADLLAFLSALTDSIFLHNPQFAQPQ